MTPELQKIHDASMAMLDRTGMIFGHEKVLDMLSKRGIRVSGRKAFFTEKEVMDRIIGAPAEFTIRAHNQVHDITIGGDRVVFMPGYGASKIVDGDGSVRNGTVADYITLLKLTHECRHFHVNGGPLVQPCDIPVTASLPLMVYLSQKYSDKCLMVPNGGQEEMELLSEILDILHGETFRQGAAVTMTNINPISPLQIDEKSLMILDRFARHNQPVVVTAGPMAGTTGPMTLSGSIALANAEILATIAVQQMIRPGAPVVYGMVASTADMRTGNIAIGTPERALGATFSSRLAKAYGLPCRGGGAETDAPVVDAQSGYEGMMNLMTSVQEKINIIYHSAGILGGFAAMSFEKYILDIEMVGMVKSLSAGIDTDPESLALDVVHEVGPGGNFMSHDHTLEKCRQEGRIPMISSRGILGSQTGRAQLLERIEMKYQQLLAGYTPPDDCEPRVRELGKLLVEKGYPIHLDNNF